MNKETDEQKERKGQTDEQVREEVETVVPDDAGNAQTGNSDGEKAAETDTKQRDEPK